ncbi:hypothetical protein CKF59_04640 [Psittacicella gerlachiana]|uniref:Uncharacterized protein n=1 Tax=Psittacicella gerlachiana TaxID=2028574 RepID=A0A3A1YBB9_9GAMM|nr:hypothetical protein CKF59_04640 [Psittacicella gerlachiana]
MLLGACSKKQQEQAQVPQLKVSEAVNLVKSSFADPQAPWSQYLDIKFSKRNFTYENFLRVITAYNTSILQPQVINKRYTILQLDEFFTLAQACRFYLEAESKGKYTKGCKFLVATATTFDHNPHAFATYILDYEMYMSSRKPLTIYDRDQKEIIFENVYNQRKDSFTTNPKIQKKNLTFTLDYRAWPTQLSRTHFSQVQKLWKDYFNLTIKK